MIDSILILGLIFIIGFAAVLTSRKLKIPITSCLIIVGLLSGYFVSFEDFIEIILIGILFLVFYIGLRTDFEGFKLVSADSINIGVLQIIIMFGLSFSIAYFMGISIINSLYLGLAASLASTLTGTDLFEDHIRMDLHHGQISTGANFIQDFLGVIIISGLAMASFNEGIIAAILTTSLLILSLIFRQFISPKIQKAVKTIELRTIVGVAVFGSFAAISLITDISLIAASFAGGLAFSKGVDTEDYLDVLEPIKDFFAVILFVGIGALVSSPSSESLIIGTGLLILILFIRPLIVIATMLIDGHSARTSFKTSLNLIQISEFAVAAVLVGYTTSFISDIVLESVVLATAGSMIIASFSSKHSETIFEKLVKPFRKIENKLGYTVDSVNNISDHIIVAGFDERGEKIAKKLEEMNLNFLIIDYNRRKIQKAEDKGYKTVFGDFLDNRTWEAAQISKSNLLISTSPHKPIVDQIVKFNKPSIVLVDSKDMEKELEKHSYIEPLLESELIKHSLENKVKKLFN